MTKKNKEAKMRYITDELYEFIENFQELGQHDNMVEAQKELTKRLRHIPLGMIINPPLTNQKQQLQKENQKEKNLINI